MKLLQWGLLRVVWLKTGEGPDSWLCGGGPEMEEEDIIYLEFTVICCENWSEGGGDYISIVDFYMDGWFLHGLYFTIFSK